MNYETVNMQKKIRKYLTNPTNNDIISHNINLFALHTDLQYKLNRQGQRPVSGHDSDSGILHPRDSSYTLLVSWVFLYTPKRQKNKLENQRFSNKNHKTILEGRS